MSIRLKLLFGIATIGLVYLSAAGPVAAPKFADWGPPVLVPNVNSEFVDSAPAISRDGRSLYFTSNRPGGLGNNDIWVSGRARVEDAWGSPVNLGPTINTNGNDASPALSRDGHWLFLNSTRAGGFGAFDLWVSYRRHTHDDSDWGTPVNLGPNINSSNAEFGASYLAIREQDDDDDKGSDENSDENENGLAWLYFGSNRLRGPVQASDLFVSAQNSDGSFGPPTFLSELNSACDTARPSIRSSGLEIFFHSGRSASGGGCATNDLWVATRDTLSQVWNTPENLGTIVNGPSIDQQPYIASDGRTLYFASDRPGGPGLLDLYMTTRNKGKASDLEK